MKLQLCKIALVGMGISLCGTLPFGTLNTMAMQIAIEQDYLKASLFAMGAALVETIYLSITLYALDKIRKHQKILLYAEWLTVIIFLVIAVSFFYKAYYPLRAGQIQIVDKGHFIKGILLSAVNPAQFPFWMGWNTALFSKGLLQPHQKFYISYISGASIGTLTGLGAFIIAGHILQHHFTIHQQYIYVTIGIFFLVCAIVQQYKTVTRKDAIASGL